MLVHSELVVDIQEEVGTILDRCKSILEYCEAENSSDSDLAGVIRTIELLAKQLEEK